MDAWRTPCCACQFGKIRCRRGWFVSVRDPSRHAALFYFAEISCAVMMVTSPSRIGLAMPNLVLQPSEKTAIISG